MPSEETFSELEQLPGTEAEGNGGGEGGIELRWEVRMVMSPGPSAWHPANRKVKLSVTVGDLNLSQLARERLLALVGKRYHSGRDELTITSER